MQHLKAYFLTAVLSAACLLSARAQEPVETPEAPAPRREIGFGTNIILGPIFSSGSAPLDLMYRWGNDQSLYRLGTSLSYGTNRIYSDDLTYMNHSQVYATDIFLGREWRVEAAKRWLVNFGGDIVFNYFHSSRQSENSENIGEGDNWLFVHNNKTRKIGGGLRPFVGILFKINNRLLVGTEASFLAMLRRQYDLAERFTLVNEVKQDHNNDYDKEEVSWGFNVRTQPASNIFVYYRF